MWPDIITINYQFELTQHVTIRVYDQDKGADQTHLERHQLIGEVTFTVASLMCAPGQKFQGNLTGGRARSVAGSHYIL